MLEKTEDQRGWAAFCAGAAEYLAERYDLRCPDWALDPAYSMPEPWYHPVSKAFPALRKRFEQTAPEPFRKRNVFRDNRIFVNAHPSSREPNNLAELEQRRQERLSAMSPEERESYLTKMAGKPRIHIVA